MKQKSFVKRLVSRLTRNHLFMIFAIGIVVIYFISFYPNNSQYLSNILDQLHGIFIGGIFTILIVDTITQINIKEEKRVAIVIMQKSILELLEGVIKTFNATFLKFELEEHEESGISSITTKEPVSELNKLYDYYKKACYENEGEKDLYLEYLIYLNKCLDKSFSETILSYNNTSEFYKNVKNFDDKTSIYLDDYRRLWVERFLIFAGDESEKLNSIIKLDSKISEYKHNLPKYYSFIPNKNGYEGDDGDYENDNEYYDDHIITKVTIRDDFKDLIRLILNLTEILYEDIEK